MPLVTAAFCAYAAGLLVGFGGVVVAGFVVVSLVAFLALTRRRFSWLVLAGTAAGAMITSAETSRRDVECARRLAERGAATVRLRSPLGATRAANAVSVEQGCGAVVRVSSRRRAV